ncbi:MAG: hypothetical protein A2600_03805 [Candidatus Lambdaproteobacteria bacterium RIFOXYD1_FULL_56_27]|uniref:Uncharacterized protein n=1 Tax=Candidatus Lambdaproteobacteria bacterium RIFOXYD2_FULL_56_26 TaxID=1817773 RepID=A0A1F6H3I0_9PROT|nr:MAG: hypothetical protein A2557_07870 [Candidatus Lambdaproteobacteria bacterium RIFOXYD2_FULL_56_26]OGH09351.1 MAG: hypothetical protein A2600_03805 [Candidatus Lambdaproteobacteria bacterium RIFOXYD1_FULL_56_27]
MAVKPSDNSPLRWMRILARTCHLGAISLYLGGVWFGQSPEVLKPYFVAVVVSGAALMALFFNKNANWLMQNRGVVILLKLLVVSQLTLWGDSQIFVLLGLLVFSSLISHAPGSVRYYSLFHQRRLD